jgi:rod shape-determining protein MreC
MLRQGSARPGLSDWIFLAPTLVLSLALLLPGVEFRIGAAGWVRRTLLLPYHPVLAFREGPADLRAEVSGLRAQLARESLEWTTFEETLRENGRLRTLLEFDEREPGRLVPAQVVGRTVDRFGETWQLQLSGQSLARPGEPVVGVGGLVGCVYAADGGLAHVRTLRNGALQVSAMLSGSRYAGMLSWNPIERRLTLTGIPMHAEAQRGEEVITSGYGGIFPKGIPIGLVAAVGNDSTTLVKRIVVRPSTAFEETEEVFLMEN